MPAVSVPPDERVDAAVAAGRITKAQGDVTADLLKQIGMNVDFVATDWGTIGSRRAQKTPPGQGVRTEFRSSAST